MEREKEEERNSSLVFVIREYVEMEYRWVCKREVR